MSRLLVTRFVGVAVGVVLLGANARTVQGDLAAFLETHCVACHEGDSAEGSFDVASALPGLELSDGRAGIWERILKRLQSRQMPPPEADKPTEQEYDSVIRNMVVALDARAMARPRPGRTSTIRRLTRAEYANAIRDLLALDLDVSELLPKDESSHGFDNITVEELTPLLLSRYLTAAENISALAIGSSEKVSGVVVRVPQDRSQEDHVAELPLGTRGGVVIDHIFPQAGLYEVRIRLSRDRDEKVEGLFETHQLDVLVDRERLSRFEVRAPGKGDGWKVDHTNADTHLRGRIRVAGGPHAIGVTFARKWASINEIKREPFDASFNRHRHPRRTPAVYEVSITGPFESEGPSDTPSRRVIFGQTTIPPTSEVRVSARGMLERLVRRAYRRPVTEADLAAPLAFFETGLANGGFEVGIQNALAAILVNPNFLFRVETAPSDASPGEPYDVSDMDLASRLSFFLWSSIPDDELLAVAEAGTLGDRDTLRSQVDRMLADTRSEALVSNFAAQWLYLRNLASLTPDLRLFPDFDDNLREAMRRETELVVQDVIANDRSVLELLKTDFTYVNDRLAKHYDLKGVVGSHFRRVPVDGSSHRGGLLRHASILAATSYATRTSPTIRGNWVLENILGTPAPPPPPNVPTLKEKQSFEALSVRDRLAMHRDNSACAGCHNLMDPLGFALDNFDALGRWREHDGELLIDVSGILPDGQKVSGADDLEEALLKRPELFVSALTEKLLTYALGRGMEWSDRPAIREIVREARRSDYRYSSLIKGVVTSPPFLMRETPVQDVVTIH